MALPADASLLLRLDDTSNLWQDTGGTTPATANGATVQRIDDASGNGFNCTLVSGATAATLKTAQYGARSLTLAASSFTFGQPAGLVSGLNGATVPTIFAFLRPSLLATQGFLFYKGASGANRIAFGFEPNSTPNYPAFAGRYGTPGIWGYGYETSQPHSYAISYYPSEQDPSSRVFLAGACVGNKQADTPPAADTTNDVILSGVAGSSSLRFACDLCALFVYTRTLSPLEILTLSDYCYTRWGVTNPRLASPYQLVCSGNSLFTIAGSIPLPERLRRWLGLPLGSVHNLAIGGQTNSQMITDDPGRLDPLLSSLSNPLLVGWENHNEQNTTTYLAWSTARASAGWNKRLMGTMLPATSPAGFNTTRATQNPIIKAYAQAGLTIVDVGNAPVIGVDAAASDAGLFGDGVHYTETGSEEYVGPAWASAIRALMVGGGGGGGGKKRALGNFALR